jgi:cytochrome b561
MDTMTPQGVTTATRIAAGDDRTQYDPVARTLHWLTAVLVLLQFGLSQIWGFLPRPERHLLIVAHMSFGILLSVVIVTRITWRLMPGHQAPASKSGWVELAAKAVHYLLYGLLAAEAVLGFVWRWSEGQEMSFFGLLISPPFARFSKPAHGVVEDLHTWLGWGIIIVAAGHALAALYHHFVLHDDVLRRMLPRRA